MKDDGNTSRGIDFIELLTIAFITLKLLGVIKWSWLWVLSPLWITFAIILIVVAISVLINKYL